MADAPAYQRAEQGDSNLVLELQTLFSSPYNPSAGWRPLRGPSSFSALAASLTATVPPEPDSVVAPQSRQQDDRQFHQAKQKVQSSAVQGVWSLVSYVVEVKETGESFAPMGDSPTGYVIFTAEGRLSFTLSAQDRQPATGRGTIRSLNSMI